MFRLRSPRAAGFPVPVLFNIFNRPAETRRVFDVIRKVRPQYLYVKADGPRADRPEDLRNCAEARRVVERIDWDCELHTLFHQRNLGCRNSMSSGIDWFFARVDEGIILEDDCLPDPTFFTFCQDLLARYRDQERVMMISGNNFHGGRQWGTESYYFSRYAHIWGWATWRRAWRGYDVGMQRLPQVRKERVLNQVCTSEREAQFWLNNFQMVYDGRLDTWDYQWVYTMFLQRGLSVMPRVNLVSNIGFNEQATHTRDRNDRFANLKTFGIDKIVHPPDISPHPEADLYTRQMVLGLE